MMAGRPGHRRRAEVGQLQLHEDTERVEAVAHDELVVVRVGGLRRFVGHELGGEAAFVEAGDPELALPGDPMHRHGAADAILGAPVVDLATVIGAATEGKEDGVAAPDAGDGIEIFHFGPVDDVAHAAVAERDVPVHQPGALFRQGEEGRGAHLPFENCVPEIRDAFHG